MDRLAEKRHKHAQRRLAKRRTIIRLKKQKRTKTGELIYKSSHRRQVSA